jgi:hypothetical protein
MDTTTGIALGMDMIRGLPMSMGKHPGVNTARDLDMTTGMSMAAGLRMRTAKHPGKDMATAGTITLGIARRECLYSLATASTTRWTGF